MHNNYYFLRQLSKQLKGHLSGYRIAAIFSQLKDELIIALHKGENEIFIKASLTTPFCCLSFPEQYSRSGKNSVDLFQQIIGQKISDVVQIEQDRSFYVQTSAGYSLLFKMHGNRSNIVLIKKEEVVQVFKNKLKQDFDLKIEDLHREVKVDYSALQNVEGDYKKLIPTFGNAFDDYFHQRQYALQSPEQQYALLAQLLEYLKNPGYFIYQNPGKPPQLRLYQTTVDDIQLSNPISALNELYRLYTTTYRLQKEKAEAIHALESQIRKSESYIFKSTQQLDKIASAESYKNMGDLIMAHLHLIEPHTDHIDLLDFYTQQPVRIKLKPTISPQLNAEKYYKKAKKQQMEVDALLNNIAQKRAEIAGLRQQIEMLDKVGYARQLQKALKPQSSVKELPYHQVKFMGFEILIGKNAKKNELLTFHVAKKDDLFLHAKDAAGSHVVVRKQGNQNFPQPVIEKAAALAAYFSKNKSVSLCNVLYTPRKYVRKAKGGPAGAVLIEREKVILVKPEKIQDALKD